MQSATPTLADLDALATEEPFVRALARSLVFDASQVDDVVQQTWLECLRRRVPEGDHRRPWLARVVRSRAANLRRSEGRRRAREEAAARPDGGHAPDELIERAENRRRVVEAVLELPPIYRQIVLLRYFENLPPRKIAAELRMPANTVSTRLRRALDMLRERFDHEHGGDRRRWQLALVPLAVPSGRAAAMAAAGGSATAWISAIGLPWFVVVALGLAAAAWWVTSRLPQESGGPEREAVAESAFGDRAGDVAVPASDTPATSAGGGTRVELATAGAAPSVRADAGLAIVTGQLVTPDGVPAPDRVCRLWTFDPMIGFGSAVEPFAVQTAEPGPRRVDAVTDAEGRFRFDEVPAGGLAALWLDHGGTHSTWWPLSATPPPGGRLDLGIVQLALRGAVRGTVVGDDGAPLEGAEVWAADVPGAILRVAPIDRLDPDGALLIALPEDASTASADAYHERLRRHLSAWVLQAAGDARFQVLPMPAWARDMLAELPIPRTRTDAAGRFELSGLAPGDNVLVVEAPGHATGGRPRIAVRAGEVRDTGHIRLDAAEPFVARVLDANGAPLREAEVRVALRPRIGLTGILFASSPERTGGDGTVAIDTLPRGEVVVAYRGGEGGSWCTAGPFGTDEQVDLTLPAPVTLRVQVRDEADRSPEAFHFRVWQGPPFGEITAAGLQPVISLRDRLRYAGAREGGHEWVIDGLTPGLFSIAIGAEDAATALRLVELRPGANDPLEVELHPGGNLRVVVQDGAGGAVEGAEVFVHADLDRDSGFDGSLLYSYGGVEGWDRLGRGGLRTTADGSAVVESIPAGGGTVIARHPALGVSTLRYAELVPELRLTLEPPGSVHGRLTLRGTTPPAGEFRLSASLLGPASETAAPEVARCVVPDADGEFRFERLTPGRWLVAIDAVDRAPRVDSLGGLIEAMTPGGAWGVGAPRSEIVTVPSGEDVEVTWEIDATAAAPGTAAATVKGRVTVDGAAAAGWKVLARTETDSWNVFETEFAVTAADGSFVRNDAAPRPLELIVQDPRSPGAPVWHRRVDPSTGPLELAIDVERASLTVRVVDPHGRPAAEHDVFVEGEHRSGGGFVAHGVTDAAGRCALPVWAGRAGLSVVGHSGHVEVTDLTLSGAVTSELQLGTSGMFTGRVLSTPEFTAEWIGVRPADGRWSSMSSLGADGAFTISDLDPGRYLITVVGDGDTRESVPREIEIGANGRVGEVLRVGPPIER